jgi:inward rectifier potassium channel
MLNRDGTFNVVRRGLPLWDRLHPYHRLLAISWPWFLALVGACYVAVNLLFAAGYTLCGPGSLDGIEARTGPGRFLHAFFFSVQTLATIGYGRITPVGWAANSLVALEALVGLMGFALITGILFARFSRPIARIAFSSHALIAPYREGRALMFRVANRRINELSDVQASVTLAWFEERDGKRTRRFHQLPLERDRVMFLPTQWVVVHPITEASPLHAASDRSAASADAEVLILMSATDETFSQTVQTRSSYKHDEIVWGARFKDIHATDSSGRVSLDISRVGEYEPAALPVAGVPDKL